MTDICFERLAHLDGLWRVDSFGEIFKLSGEGLYIHVYFSKLRDDIDLFARPYHSSTLAQDPHVHRHNTHVRNLFVFRIGSIWKDGLLYLRPQDIFQEDNIRNGNAYESVRINTANTHTVRLKQSLHEFNIHSDTVVAENYFTLGNNRDNLAKSFYKLIPVENDPSINWLVIPSSELFRHYYGQSTRLCSSILRKTTSKYVDWDGCGVIEGRPKLVLKKPLSLLEQKILLRAIHSKIARRALEYSHKLLAATAANSSAGESQPRLLDAKFPFEDFTTLQLFGKRMPLAFDNRNNQQWALFTLEIIHCSKELGFDNGIVNDYYAPKGSPAGQSRSGDQGSDNTELEEEETLDDYLQPANRRLARTQRIVYSNPFANCNKIKIERQHLGKQSRPRKGESSDTEQLNSNDGNYSEDAKDTRGYDEVGDENAKEAARSIMCFLKALDQLKILIHPHKLKLRTRKTKLHFKSGSYFVSQFPKKIAKVRSKWNLIKKTDPTIQRQIIFVEIHNTSRDEYIYIAELELSDKDRAMSTLVFHHSKYNRIHSDFFNRFLILIAKYNRWPPTEHDWEGILYFRNLADNLFKDIKFDRFKHPSKLRNADIKPDKDKQSGTTPKEWGQQIFSDINKIKRDWFIHYN